MNDEFSWNIAELREVNFLFDELLLIPKHFKIIDSFTYDRR